MLLVFATRSQPDPNLLSLSRMRYARPFNIGSGEPSLLSSPRVGGISCHADVDHSARVQFDDEEGEQRMEEKVSYREKVTGPDLLCMGV